MTPSFWQLSQNCWQIPSKSTYQIVLHNCAHGQQSNTFASSPGTPHPRDLRPGTPARVHLPRPSLEIPTQMTCAWGRAPHAQGARFHMPYGNRPWPMANGGWGPWPRVPPGSSWCHPQGHVANLRLSISASTAPRPRMHPPRRCSGVVAGRLPPPFRPALSTVSFPSWGRVSLRLGDASYFCSTSLLCTLYRRVHLGSRHTMHASEVSDADPLRCISCMLLCSGSCKLLGSPGILKFPGGADAGALRPPQHLHMPCWAYPVDSRPFYSGKICFGAQENV